MIHLNRKGQGTTEYIVILAIIVGIAIALGTGPLGSAIKAKMASVASDIK